jgi:hypothetical protein
MYIRHSVLLKWSVFPKLPCFLIFLVSGTGRSNMSGKAAKVLITERQQVFLELMSRSATIA